jgi:tetratricopeptide (TPR) repeat protein
MALRPNNHITGDSAVNQIKAQLIPEAWIVNDQTNDYGLDLNVQVCQDNHTTECFFFIQSKGTEDVSYEGEISYAMSVERLKDYRNMPLPVLLVYYSKTENVFWGIWANGIYNTLTDEQKEQKHYSVRFHRRNIITSSMLEAIGSNIKLEVVTRVDFRTENAARDYQQLHKQIYTLLEQLYPNRFSIGNDLAADVINVDYERVGEDVSLMIHNKEEDVKVPKGMVDEAFLWYPKVKMSEAPFVVQTTVAALGMLCEFKKDEHYPYHIYKEAIIDALLPIIPDKYWLNWAFGIPISKVELFEYLVSKDMVTNYTEVLNLLQIVLFMRQETELKPLREKLLQLLLDSGELTSEQKGHMCYNIANQVCMRDLSEAISLYKHSARYFPTYLTVDYWWKDMASMMFHAGHYYFSQKFYEKALTLTDNIENKCELILLIADTCLYQKNIEAAQSWLQKYFDTCAEAGQAVPSKVHLLSRAYEFYKYELEHGGKMYDKGDDWFNEAIRNYRRFRYKKSLYSFIIAWAYAIYDFEVLKNAMIMALRIGDATLLLLIIETIRNLFRQDRINELIDMVIQWKLPSKSKEGLLRILRGDDITSMLDA